jgi:hypothetical protein
MIGWHNKRGAPSLNVVSDLASGALDSRRRAVTGRSSARREQEITLMKQRLTAATLALLLVGAFGAGAVNANGPTDSATTSHFAGVGNGSNQDNDRGQGHGARKGAFFLNPDWSCPTGAKPLAKAATYGFAVLNTTGHHMLNVNVVLKGAQPNATYDVWVNQDPGAVSAGACPLAAATKTGAVHTNAKGNGTAHLRVTLVSGATHFWVSATNGTTGTIVLRTRAVSLTIKH